jgi:hypothetical protein
MKFTTLPVVIMTMTAAILSAHTLSADTLTNAGYPPPGNVTLGQSGSPGSGSGKTFSYSNLNMDPSLYSAFYWGPTSVKNVDNAGDPAAAQMVFAGMNGSAYEFDSTATWNLNSLQDGNQNLNTRMLLTVTGLGAEDTEANDGASTDPLAPLFLVTATSFSANYVFQAEEGAGNWVPVLTLFNSLNTNGATVQTSAGFSFFTDPVSTPEPGTWAMIGSGMGLLGLLRRRAASSSSK